MFQFKDFLIKNGFTYSDYRIHQLYEIEKVENGKNFYYCVNLQGKLMTTNENKTEKLKVDIPIPETEEDANKWLLGFLG